MERVREEQRQFVLSELGKKVSRKTLSARFGSYINNDLRSAKCDVVQTTSIEKIADANVSSSKNSIKDEMFASGYRMIGRTEEIASLSEKYTISADRPKEVGQMIFAPAFPEEMGDGENNLVIVYRKNGKLNIEAFASTKYVNNLTNNYVADIRDHVADIHNLEVSKPAIMTVSWDDQKGKEIIFDAAIMKTAIKMKHSLGLQAAA